PWLTPAAPCCERCAHTRRPRVHLKTLSVLVLCTLCTALVGCGSDSNSTDGGVDAPADTGTTADAATDAVSDAPADGTDGHAPTSGAVSVALGSTGHSCALMADGTVRCWGLD